MTDSKDLETKTKPIPVGDFAEGQSPVEVTTGELRGDFAAGMEEKARQAVVQPRGDFGVDHEQQPPEPTAVPGDFARGQESVEPGKAEPDPDKG